MYMESCTNISYFGVYTSELIMEKATYHDNRVFFNFNLFEFEFEFILLSK